MEKKSMRLFFWGDSVPNHPFIVDPQKWGKNLLSIFLSVRKSVTFLVKVFLHGNISVTIHQIAFIFYIQLFFWRFQAFGWRFCKCLLEITSLVALTVDNKILQYICYSIPTICRENFNLIHNLHRCLVGVDFEYVLRLFSVGGFSKCF